MICMDYTVTQEELIERAVGLRQRMVRAGLDALLLTTGDNLRYVSGYPSPLHSGPRPFLFILPVSGEPVFIVHAGREAEARRFSWATDIRTYYPLSHAPIDQTVEALRELKLERARIGVEIGAEQCLDIPLSDFWDIQACLPGAVFADSAPVLWGARLHKTAKEIARIRQACSITSVAYDRAYSAMQAGMTEQEAAQLMKNAMLALGAEDTLLEPGMVITIEPGVATDFGVFHVEQNVLVTETGHEVLSTASTGIRQIGE